MAGRMSVRRYDMGPPISAYYAARSRSLRRKRFHRRTSNGGERRTVRLVGVQAADSRDVRAQIQAAATRAVCICVRTSRQAAFGGQSNGTLRDLRDLCGLRNRTPSSVSRSPGSASGLDQRLDGRDDDGRSGRCGRSVVVRSGRSVVVVGRVAAGRSGVAARLSRRIVSGRAPLAMASRSDCNDHPAGSVVRLATLDLAPEVLHFKRPEPLTNGFRHDGRPLIHRQPGLLDKRKPLGRAREILRRRRLRLTLQLPDLVARQTAAERVSQQRHRALASRARPRPARRHERSGRRTPGSAPSD